MKKTKRFLITTALEETWADDRPVLFLGEWCLLYSRKERWSKMDAELLPYHWSDRSRFHADYLYLNGFYERVLGALVIRLNDIHGTAHSLRYWRILIGPWLAYLIHMLFDRWQSIHAALEHSDIEGSIVISGNDDESIPNDMDHFLELFIEDEWNHYIYAAILQRIGSVPCINTYHTGNKSSLDITGKSNIKTKAAIILAKAASYFVKEHDAFMVGTYLPLLSEVRLQLRFRQVPQWWRKVSPVKILVDREQRNWEMPVCGDTDFEKFVLDMIPRQIPTVFLEGYKQLLEQTHKLPWPQSPKLIYTANVLWHDSVSMAYTAEKTELGTPLVYGQHGGAYGVEKFTFGEEHEIRISDRYLTWGWSSGDDPSVVPVGMGMIVNKAGQSHNANKKLLLVTQNIPRYTFRLCSESGRSFIGYLENNFTFASLLRENIRDDVLVRLTSWERGWCQFKRWEDRFPKVELELGCRKIHDLMQESRLVVLSYNSTGILETLAMGIPVVLFFDIKVAPLRDAAIPYYAELKRVGIFHDTPESAASHVNRIWDDVDAWWTGADVQEAVACFSKQYCYRTDDFLDRVEGVLRIAIANADHDMSAGSAQAARNL